MNTDLDRCRPQHRQDPCFTIESMSFRLRRSVLTTQCVMKPPRLVSQSRRWPGRQLGRSKSLPKYLDSRGFKVLSTTDKIEEENWAWYSADLYYPVRIGATFHARYQVLGKLGYGAHSTAWLGRDLQYACS